MDYWQQFKTMQTEGLRLQTEIFELTCSIQLLRAEQTLASDEQLLALKMGIDLQKKEFYKDISYQLYALAQLNPKKYDNECSC